MNQKELRKYDLVCEIGTVGGVEHLRELAGIDFAAAFDVWEWKLSKNINAFGAIDVLAMFEAVSESKARAILLEDAALLKLVYGVSEESCSGANLKLLCSLILASKCEQAEDILKLVKSNPTGDFSGRMKAVVDGVFEMSMGKTGTKKATLNHKQTILLFDFVSKMKSGATKNILTQRLKEL
jgi:hypothetical protein